MLMFIRKRTYNSKKYGVRESYRVVEGYREHGKVKQRTLANLGRFPTPEQALEHAKYMLGIYERIVKGPIRRGPYRTRGKQTQESLLIVEKAKLWVKQLEAVVSEKSS